MLDKLKIEKSKRKSFYATLGDFGNLFDKNGFIEVTEWTNGMGVDVVINNYHETVFKLTFDEYQIFKQVMKEKFGE